MGIAEQNLQFIADCPICSAQKITFDALECYWIPDDRYAQVVFSACRHCSQVSLFDIRFNSQGFLYQFNSEGIIINSLASSISLHPPVFGNLTKCPEHSPEEVKAAFDEANRCIAIAAWSAAGAMFRRCIDLATRNLIPSEQLENIGQPEHISWKIYKDLRLRIDWLISRNHIDRRISPLIDCIREDGNDAAHAAESLDHDACLDLLDFSVAVLNVVFTEPGKIGESIRRRNERRST